MKGIREYYRSRSGKILKYANILMKNLKDRREIEEKMMRENVRKAHREWKDKENYFHSVIDEDLIDYAIYDLEASKIKYLYLLKKLRQSNSLNR
ncbi:MAG: DUF2508 family protein [Tissierellia bacterium]|nr:DUF2508 family protein [Tissierellia bacterium]